MSKKLRTLSAFIALTMLLFIAAGCVKDPDPTESVSSSVSVASTADSTESKLYDDTVEDMGGYEFTIATAWMRQRVPANATLFERLFHQRMEEVEAEYKCTIKIETFYASMEGMIPKIMAGDKIGDVVQMIGDMYLPAAGAGYLRSWDEVSDIVNLNDTRWLQDYKATALNGEHYVLGFERPGDIGSILWYNKNILKSAGITEDPAQLVLDGEWTWEKFREMLELTTMDTDNDGNKDIFGLISNNSYIDVAYALAASNNASMVSESANGLVASFNNKAFIDALNFYDTLVNTDKTVKIYENMTSDLTWSNMPSFDTIVNEFRGGKIAFMSGRLYNGNQQLRPFIDNFDYGLVVYPKGPEADGYISNGEVLGGFALTSTNEDYIKSAKIFNALARPVEGYEDPQAMADEVRSDFFQENDELSYQMYELAANTVRVDKGYGVVTLLSAMNHTIIQSIFWRFNTPASAIDGMSGVYDQDITNTYAKLPE